VKERMHLGGIGIVTDSGSSLVFSTLMPKWISPSFSKRKTKGLRLKKKE
jgi:hypothetical protein